jgi:hypothetical protein
VEKLKGSKQDFGDESARVLYAAYDDVLYRYKTDKTISAKAVSGSDIALFHRIQNKWGVIRYAAFGFT